MHKIILISLAFLFTVGCQKNNEDLLQEAQNCLNTAPASQARSCVEKISSLTTPSAYKLKCSAIYISEGFGAASSLIGAMDEINTPSSSNCTDGNCSSTLLVMTKFKFSGGDNADPNNRQRNLDTADEAVNMCQNAQSKAFLQVSSLFKMGTLATMKAYDLGLNPSQEPTVDDLDDIVAQLPPEEIGELALVTYNSTCFNNKSPSDAVVTYCEELSKSISSYGDDYTAIGNCLIAKLDNPNAVCPP